MKSSLWVYTENGSRKEEICLLKLHYFDDDTESIITNERYVYISSVINSGCGVPGIMASRTIENDRDRKMTIMTTTFVPCGAKLPIIALVAGAFFDNAWWVTWSAYFVCMDIHTSWMDPGR